MVPRAKSKCTAPEGTAIPKTRTAQITMKMTASSNVASKVNFLGVRLVDRHGACSYFTPE